MGRCGSRRANMAYFLLVLHLLALSMRFCDGAVMSVDLGSEWMKVAVVNLRPGQAPISIALNEMSKRKSAALVAFSNGERLLAEEAAAINVRYPERVYSRVRDMVGKTVEFVNDKILDPNFLPYDVVADDRGAVIIRTHDKQSIYRSEELLAMVLSYGRELAEAHAKSTIKDVVITVPPYMGQAERQAVTDAAHITGMTVLALINEHSAAALQYGIDKDFGNESRNVVFYDMGANSLYAAVVSFSAYSGKEKGKTTMFNQFQVKGVRWDASLGGQTLEGRLLDHFADEFNAKVGKGFEVRKFPKSMAKLKKQVKRTKEILSANTEAPLSVEAIYEENDFRSSITRQKFEELCGDIWERALAPLKDVITETGLTVADIYAVELIGGATRVPKLQAVLSDYLGKKALDRHLDADEAVALGASLHAANLSDRVKLNRKLGMVDGASYSIVWKIEGASPNAPDQVDEDQILVHRQKKLPSKVYRTLKNQQADFKVLLEYHPSLLPPGSVSPDLAAFQISGVADAAKKYAFHNLSAPIKTNLHFSLSWSGMVYLDKAESVVEISEWYEVPVLEDAKSKLIDDGLGIEEDKKDQDTLEAPTKDGLSDVDESAKEQPLTEPVVKKKLRTKTIRVPLKVKDQSKGVNQLLSSRSLEDSVDRLGRLQKKDFEKRATAESKNTLESYIYATKERLYSVDNIDTVSTEHQRDSLLAELNEAEDWLYMDGEGASAQEFQKKFSVLKTSGDSIFNRLGELKARPVAVQAAKSSMETVEETLEGWEKSKPWIPEKSRELVRMDMKNLQEWLDDVEAKQRKLKGYEEPAFTSTEVYAKVTSLKALVSSMNKLPKPKAPKAAKPTEDVKPESSSDESSAKEGLVEDDLINEPTFPNEEKNWDSQDSEANIASETLEDDVSHDEL